jgi:hypothetical protein
METVTMIEVEGSRREESALGAAMKAEALLCLLIKAHDPFQKEPRAPFTVGEA